MIIYTTLKANREAGNDFVNYVDECITQVGRFFGEEYMDEYDYTDWHKIWNDFTDKQIESKVLKGMKEDAKDREDGSFFKYKNILIDRGFAYEDIEEAIKEGILICSDLRAIQKQSEKYNFKIEADIKDNETGYWHMRYMSDLIEQYFPCHYNMEGECNNCGNCN